MNTEPYTIQKGYRRIKQTENGWLAQEKLFFFWVSSPVTDLNGVSGTLEFCSLQQGIKWLNGKRVVVDIKY